MVGVSTVFLVVKVWQRYELIFFSLVLREQNLIHRANKGKSKVHPLFGINPEVARSRSTFLGEEKGESLPGSDPLSFLLSLDKEGRRQEKGDLSCVLTIEPRVLNTTHTCFFIIRRTLVILNQETQLRIKYFSLLSN